MFSASRGFLNLRNNLIPRLSKPQTKIRCFSALVAPTPKEAVDFFLQNRELIKQARSEEDISALAQNYFPHLIGKAQNSSDDLSLYLRSLAKFNETNAESIFFQGVKKSLFQSEEEGVEFLSFLSNMTANIAGYVPQSEENAIEIRTRIQHEDGTESISTRLLPHVDDLFADDRPLKFLSFLGIEAPSRNYRTYILNHKDVVDGLSERSKAVLQEPIFQDFWLNYKPQPILIDRGKGNYDINFSTEASDQGWSFDTKYLRDKTITLNEIESAIENIKSTILDIYHQNKLTEYHIGDMDVLCLKNRLHGRDQVGVPFKNLLDTRRLLSLAYTEKPSTSAALTNVASVKHVPDNQI
jgi:hypothetical protein